MKRILIIEDDKNAQELYTEILTNAGYYIDTASDGAEGLEKINRGGYDLTFLDIMLPKMDGLSVLSAAKSQTPKDPNGKIIVLSNLTHDPVIKEALEMGASDHISKTSFNPSEFIAKVKSFLN